MVLRLPLKWNNLGLEIAFELNGTGLSLYAIISQDFREGESNGVFMAMMFFLYHNPLKNKNHDRIETLRLSYIRGVLITGFYSSILTTRT